MSTPATLLLVRHAPTRATRTFRFPADEPLDGPGCRDAAELNGLLVADRAVTSPMVRCRVTAELAGFPQAEVDPDLAELDFGDWSGREVDEVAQAASDRLQRWYADPAQAPTGGERLTEMAARVTAALERQRCWPDRTAIFTHGGPIKVAVLGALSAPLTAIWRLDVAPCSVTELHSRPDGGWTVTRINVPLNIRARSAA